MSDEEITHYVNEYKPFDKAGAYGIQEWIGYIGITGIRGSYYNVMGLPVQRIYEELKKIGFLAPSGESVYKYFCLIAFGSFDATS